MDISPTEDLEMVSKIKQNVKQLNTKTNISAQIALNEDEEKKIEQLNRLIYRKKGEPEIVSNLFFSMKNNRWREFFIIKQNYFQQKSKYISLSQLQPKQSIAKPSLDRSKSGVETADRTRPTTSTSRLTAAADQEIEFILNKEDTGTFITETVTENYSDEEDFEDGAGSSITLPRPVTSGESRIPSPKIVEEVENELREETIEPEQNKQNVNNESIRELKKEDIEIQ